MMAAGFMARGLKCVGVDGSQEGRAEVRSERGAAVMFLEYLPGEHVDAAPGDKLIVIKTVEGASADAQHSAPAPLVGEGA